ncbi:MAG: cell division protein FtsZ [Oscillospiraceae bacterium]|nr:cell division protein FtsZ [Oscillospiraceae bacterium]
MKFTLENESERATNIKVVGVGGAGGNAVNRMVNDGVQNVEFIAVNTDKQVLDVSKADIVIQIGEKVSRGHGAGGNPERGQKAAEENREEIMAALKGTDLLFITAGMGGGTGTGAAPVVAEVAREMNILTIAVVTKPFSYEGRKRMNYAEQGLLMLREMVDSLVIIPNDRIREIIDPKTSMVKAFEEVDGVLKRGITSISDLISTNGFINLDFEDLCSVIRNAGLAHMGVGYASGKDKADAAADMAVSSPLLDTSIAGAKAAIVNITASPDLPFGDADLVSQRIQKVVDPDASIFWGIVYDENMTDEMQVTVIATGFEDRDRAEARAAETVPAVPQPAQGVSQAAAPQPAQPAPQAPAAADGRTLDDGWPDLLKIFQ